jgi:hypothetical protein
MLDEHTLEYRGRIFVALDADRIVGGSRQLQEDAFEPFTTPQPSVKPLEHLQPFSTEWWLYIVCALSCVVSAAFAAGLTMGLVALDPMQVRADLTDRPQSPPFCRCSAPCARARAPTHGLRLALVRMCPSHSHATTNSSKSRFTWTWTTARA